MTKTQQIKLIDFTVTENKKELRTQTNARRRNRLQADLKLLASERERLLAEMETEGA